MYKIGVTMTVKAIIIIVNEIFFLNKSLIDRR